MSNTDRQPVPSAIREQLRAYSNAFERQDGRASSYTFAIRDGIRTACDVTWAPKLMAEVAGVTTLMADPGLRHEFIVQEITTDVSTTVVRADAEIAMQCEDGNMLLGTFPARIVLSGTDVGYREPRKVGLTTM